jgi:hypothetical protein
LHRVELTVRHQFDQHSNNHASHDEFGAFKAPIVERAGRALESARGPAGLSRDLFALPDHHANGREQADCDTDPLDMRLIAEGLVETEDCRASSTAGSDGMFRWR